MTDDRLGPGSLRARLAARTARWFFGARLGPAPDVARVRRVLGRSGLPSLPGVRYEPAILGGIGGEWVRARGGAPGRRLLYLHGGGFVACSARTYRPLTGALARRGFEVFVPNYRRAPEHRHPVAEDDAAASWAALAEAGPAVLAADSAGGHLALGLMLRARDAGGAVPRAAALFSPFLDLGLTGDSVRENAARDGLLGGALLRHLARAYLGEAEDPAPPLGADLAGLPPLLLHVGEREVLRDDSVRLAAVARAAGVPVELALYPGVPHTWQIAAAFLPEARRSLDAAAAFLMGQLAAGEGA